MQTLGYGMGVLALIIPAALVIFIIIIAILTLLAINNLHRLPQIQQSVENIEKYLKFLTRFERERLIKEGYIPSGAESDTEKADHT